MTPDWSTPAVLQWRGAASFGWLVVLLAWETLAPCFVWFRSLRDRGTHAWVNFAVAVVNVVVVALVFVGLWKWTADWAARNSIGLLHWIDLPGWARLAAAVLLLDCWTYVWHRANHRLPFLWRFHRVHHSDARMDVTTANRFHLGEIVLSSLLRLSLIPLLGIRLGDLVLYETLLQGVVQWHHANIRLPARWEQALRWWVVTPGLHKVHHSRHPLETDSNYASLLPLWDRLFRSLRTRERPEEIAIGLDGFDAPEQQSVAGLARTPFTEPPATNFNR